MSSPLHPLPRSAFIGLSCGSVHYLEAGSGPPLVLLHANPGDSRDFESVMPELARSHRVIALDWPGFGRSPMPDLPHTWDALSFYRVLLEFLARMNLQRALFIGNSLGGNVAARLAIEAPERVSGLVLVSAGGFTPHNVVTRGFCRLQGSALSWPPRWWAGMYLRHRNACTEAMLARAAGEQSSGDRVVLQRAVWRSFVAPSHDLRARAQQIQCPTLLMFGAQDPAISARKDGREAQRCMPHARKVTLPCGHAPFAEVPELFLREVQAFLLASSAEAGAVNEDAVGVANAVRRRLR